MTEENKTEEVVAEVQQPSPTASEELTELLYDAYDDYEEDEAEDSKSKSKLLLFLCSLAVLILVTIGVVVYRFYPLPMKVQGHWVAETVNGNFELENKGKQTTFIMKNLNDFAGIDMVFQSEFVANDMNEYFVENTTVYLQVSRKVLNDEQISQLIGDEALLKEGLKTEDKVIVNYTQEGLKANFGEQDLDDYFKYMLREFKGLKGTSFVLRNDTFAGTGIQFKRK